MKDRFWAGSCLWLLFFLFSITAYAAAGETSRAVRLALLISATRCAFANALALMLSASCPKKESIFVRLQPDGSS